MCDAFSLRKQLRGLVTILGEEDLMVEHCIALGSRIYGRQALYTCHNLLDCAGKGVESARMVKACGNEYIGVDSN